jgi:hypothetical protein
MELMNLTIPALVATLAVKNLAFYWLQIDKIAAPDWRKEPIYQRFRAIFGTYDSACESRIGRIPTQEIIFD